MKTSGKDAVKIGLVSYAGYVNVGIANRSQSWVSVPADYSTTSQQTCTTRTTQQQCTQSTAQTCTHTVDGVPESYDCTPSSCTTVTVAPYQSCSGGGTTSYTWYGCVGSRTSGSPTRHPSIKRTQAVERLRVAMLRSLERRASDASRT